MTFKPFDKSKLEAYEKPAKKSRGDTDAFKEFEKRSKGKESVDMQRDAGGLRGICQKSN